jgi:hypothetical protein
VCSVGPCGVEPLSQKARGLQPQSLPGDEPRTQKAAKAASVSRGGLLVAHFARIERLRP